MQIPVMQFDPIPGQKVEPVEPNSSKLKPTLEMIRAICGSMEKWRRLATSDNYIDPLEECGNKCALCDYDRRVRDRKSNADIKRYYGCYFCPIDMISKIDCYNTPWGEVNDLHSYVCDYRYIFTDEEEQYTREQTMKAALNEYKFIVELYLWAVDCYQNKRMMVDAEAPDSLIDAMSAEKEDDFE